MFGKPEFNYRILLATALVLSGISQPATSGPCDAHFTFDDSLADSGGNGYDGEMIGVDGAPAKPGFTEGKFGKALLLNGTAGMQAYVDLN